VRSQRGSGNVVVRGEAPGQQAFPPIRTIADLLRSYEFRMTVEAATAAMAAERRDADDLGDLARTLDRAATALDNGVHHLLADLNFEFHRAVARATHNPFYLKTIEMIPNFIGAERLDVATFGLDDLPERARRIHGEHVSVYEAIRAHDARGAVREIEAHIAGARDYVLERHTFTAPGGAAP
jgi:DNA-binding FadR family transcriptional regulator